MGTNNELGSKGNEDFVFGSAVKSLYQITAGGVVGGPRSLHLLVMHESPKARCRIEPRRGSCRIF
jgi:hypothetical protein